MDRERHRPGQHGRTLVRPNTGQFTSRDTQANNPVPSSANANPFAYGNDSPLLDTDPTGHRAENYSDVQSDLHAAAAAAAAVQDEIDNAAEADFDHCTGGCLVVHSRLWATDSTWVNDHVQRYRATQKHQQESLKEDAAEEDFDDCGHNGGCIAKKSQQWTSADYAAQKTAQYQSTLAERDANALASDLEDQARARAQAAAEAAAAKQNHGGGFWGFVKKAANFVYHASGLSDIVDCATHPSLGTCVQAALTIAMTVGTGGESFLGDLVVQGMSKFGVETLGKDAIETVARDGIEAAAKDGIETAAKDGVETAAKDGVETAEEDAAKGAEEVAEPDAGGSDGASCSEGIAHSFIGSTHVLLGDGSSKPIDQVKVGDVVANAKPGASGTEKHKVHAVIVTHTDDDYVDVTVKTPTGDKTITTTFHHPFDAVNESAFVQAADLKAGDKLQTVDERRRFDAVRTYHTTQVTYDLTIDGLHTDVLCGGGRYAGSRP